jgi:uncharacterized protein (UPF0147 family)
MAAQKLDERVGVRAAKVISALLHIVDENTLDVYLWLEAQNVLAILRATHTAGDA